MSSQTERTKSAGDPDGKPEAARNRWWVAAAFVLGMALLLFLSDRPVTMPNGEPVVRNLADYSAAIARADELTRPIFAKDDSGEDITAEDRKSLLDAAHALDSGNMMDPLKVVPYLWDGRAYFLLGDNEEAESRLRQCIYNLKYDKSDAAKQTATEAHYRLSQVRFKLQDFKGAYTEAKEAVKEQPKGVNYIDALASAEVQLKMIPEAKQEIRRALALDPQDVHAVGLSKLLDAATH